MSRLRFLRKKRYAIPFVILVLLLGISLPFYHSGIDPVKLRAKYAAADIQYVTIDGQDVRYRVTGQGVPLVLIHGVASSLETWGGWHAALSDSFRVISFDVPAFGITGAFPDGVYTKEHYLQFMDKLLTALHIDTCYMAGNSFGGFLTWNYALRHPEKLKKIALLDAAGYDDVVHDLGFKLASTPVINAISHRITPKFLVSGSIKNVYGDPKKVTPSIVDRYFDMILRKGNREAFSKVLNMLHQEEKSEAAMQPILGQITVPTLILWGAKDKLLPMANAAKFNRAIKGSELFLYPGVGHIPMEEIPNETAAYLRNWIRK